MILNLMNISDFVDDFLIAKEIEEGCAPSTIKAYNYDLQKFIDLIGDLDIDSPQLRTQIRLILKKIKDKEYTKKAISRKIASLRTFFKYLNINEYITIKNPMVNIKTPKIKIEENLPKFLDLADIEKILIETNDNRKFNSK